MFLGIVVWGEVDVMMSDCLSDDLVMDDVLCVMLMVMSMVCLLFLDEDEDEDEFVDMMFDVFVMYVVWFNFE